MAWAQNLLGPCFFACAPQAPFSWVLLCFYIYLFLLFLMGSKSKVSAFFRLQFRNGLGTKPAGALLFRMRSPSTFFFGLALFLVGSKSNVSGFFQAAVSHWLEHKTCSFLGFAWWLISLSLREGYSCWKLAFFFFCWLLVAEFPAIPWSGMLFRSVFCAWAGRVPEHTKIGPRRRT